MLGDWLAAAFLCGVSPRTSPCLGRRPLICFACRWLCSSLACCWLLSCSASSWLFPSRFFSSSLEIFVFFSLSSYPCCFTSFFSSFHHWLVGGSFSWSLTTGSFGCASSSESLCGRLRLRGSPSIHGKVVYNNVFCCF